jgi:hypothetical protein
MDYYERGLFNQILGQQDPQSAHGFVTYYQPMRAGGIKTYTNDYNNFTCDHGTGMESQSKFADSIYFRSADTLYVNLFIASTLSWPEKGISVRQDTQFPEQLSTKLTITTSGGATALPIKIRVPSWVQPGWQLTINGAAQTVTATPGTYITLNRTWNNGDVVNIIMPAALAVERTPDSATVSSVRFGGIVLSGAYGTTQLTSLPTLVPSSIQPTATPLQFTAQANGAQVQLIPFYKMHHQRYTVYWNTNAAPPPELVAWYRFDETGGTSAADSSGNPAGGPATLVGGTSFVTGKKNQAVRLDGASGFAQLPSGLVSNVQSCTVATWVNLATNKVLHVPDAAERQRRSPVRDHHGRRGGRAADQRGDTAGHRRLEASRGDALRRHRYPLCRRSGGREGRDHVDAVVARRHVEHLHRQVAVQQRSTAHRPGRRAADLQPRAEPDRRARAVPDPLKSDHARARAAICALAARTLRVSGPSVLATYRIRHDDHRSRRPTVVDVEPAEHALDRDRLERVDRCHATRRYALAEPLVRSTLVKNSVSIGDKRCKMCTGSA